MKDLNRVLARISENTLVFIFGEFLSFDSMTGKGLLLKTRNSVKTLKMSHSRFDMVVRHGAILAACLVVILLLVNTSTPEDKEGDEKR